MQNEKKSRIKSTKRNYYIILPEDLITAIDGIGLTETNRSTAIKIISRIVYLVKKNNYTFNNYIELPQSYLERINSSYHITLVPLIDSGIIQPYINESGKQSYTVANPKLNLKGSAKKYRINPLLMTKDFKATSYTSGKGIDDIIDEDKKKEIEAALKRIRIDENKARELSRNYINNYNVTIIDENNIKNIFQKVIQVSYSIYPQEYPMHPDKALQRANEMGKTLIKDKTKYIIDYYDEYLERKKYYMCYSDECNIKNFLKQIFSVSQKESNRRINHLITFCSKRLIPALTVDGERLVSNDLANSQMLILSYIIKSLWNNNAIKGVQDILNGYKFEEAINFTIKTQENKNNAARFINRSQYGKLYEYLSKELNITNREITKLFIYSVLFSSYKSISIEKNMFNEVFPVIGEFCRLFKKDNKDELAVMLQKVESHIFTEIIYNKCKEENILIITKHDEILSKESDAPRVKEIIEDVFNNILGIPALIKTDKNIELHLAVVKAENKPAESTEIKETVIIPETIIEPDESNVVYIKEPKIKIGIQPEEIEEPVTTIEDFIKNNKRLEEMGYFDVDINNLPERIEYEY